MKLAVILPCLLSLGLAAPSPDAYASDYGYYSPPQPLTSVHYTAPQPLPSSQFHAQDDLGQYNYGYQGDTSAKEEFKTADGVVRGSYSYVDANGIVQTTNYIADALGFRVAATNLPVHVIDEAHAAVAVEPAVAAAPIEVAPATPAVVSTYGHGSPYGVYGYGGVVRPNPTVDYAYLPYATGYNYHQVPTQYVSTYGHSIQETPIVQVAPVTTPVAVYTSAQVAPIAAPAPVVYTNVQAAPAPVVYTSAQVAPIAGPAPVVYTTAEAGPAVVPVVQGPAHVDQSQYHAQDEFGQYSFGYNDPNSVRQEVKTADGVIRGAYRYVDADGKIQTVEYIADAGGFRVAATNLPVHDVGVVVDTPEVAAAKANHAIAIANADLAAAQAAPVEVEGFVVSRAEPETVQAPVELAPVELGSGDGAADEEPSVYVEPKSAPPLPIAAITPVVAPAPIVYQTPVVAPAPVVYQTPVVAPAPIAYQTPVVAPAPVVYQTPVVAPAPVVYQTPVVAPVPVAYQTPVVAPVPVVYQTPVAAPVVHAAPHPVVTPVAAAGSQYHAQDDIGQYSFGYSDQNSIKQELRTADGVVRGSYSYVDSNGIIQTVNYIADALGFRVGATNLPVHHVDAPEAAVAAAPVEVAATPIAAPVATPSAYYGPALAPQVSYSYLPYASNYAYNAQQYTHTVPYVAPAVSVAAAAPIPIVTGTPVDVVNSQFHAQDDIGQYNYGFSNPTQTKEEIKTADGVTRGSYSYIDANGIVQTVNYISDAMGFRVAATNLPVHHIEGEAPAVAVGEAPAVAAGYSIISPSVNYAYLPYATNYGYQHTVPQAA